MSARYRRTRVLNTTQGVLLGLGLVSVFWVALGTVVWRAVA